jgi:hypothetical protein
MPIRDRDDRDGDRSGSSFGGDEGTNRDAQDRK